MLLNLLGSCRKPRGRWLIQFSVDGQLAAITAFLQSRPEQVLPCQHHRDVQVRQLNRYIIVIIVMLLLLLLFLLLPCHVTGPLFLALLFLNHGGPHRSGFKFQTAVLPVLCVMFPV